jgi:hypothetical protein
VLNIKSTEVYNLTFLLIKRSVGDKINSEDTWILIWKHLGVTSRSYISDICYDPAKEDRLGIMTSRSYQTRRRYEISRDLLVWSERTYLGYLCLRDLIEAMRLFGKLNHNPIYKDCLGMITPRIRRPRYDNTLDLPQPCYGAAIFWNLLILSERTCLGYYHLGGWSKCVIIVLEWDKASIPWDQG